MKKILFIPLTVLLVGVAACQPAVPLTVSGTIAGADGGHPPAAFVALLSADVYSSISSSMVVDETGRYQLSDAPGGRDYILVVVPMSGQTEAGYGLHGYAPQLARLKDAAGDVSHDVTLTACRDFIFEGYRADGSLLLEGDWVGLRFAEDMAGDAVEELFFGTDKGDESTAVPSVCVPVGQGRRFFFQTTIPNFGSVVLAADNEGRGYAAGEPGGSVLNLNYELARTQVSRLRARLTNYQGAGYDTPPDISAELAAAEAYLDEAAALTGAGQAAASDRATSTALWALENLELARAEQDIPRYRMGDLVITVLDVAGNPLPDAAITYAQTSHDFLFGVFDTLGNAGSAGYDLMQAAGVNYLTTGFYWNETEPDEDKVNWDTIDHEIGVLDLAEMGTTLKAHALLALWDFATPDYIKEMSFDELNREVSEHINDLVSRYRGEIDIWNVINEAHGRGAALRLSRPEITALTQTGIRAVRENDPDARIIINNSFDWYGESRVFEGLLSEDVDDFTLSVPDYLNQLNAEGVDYDIIGQQLYNGGYVSIFADWGLGDPSGVPTWDLAHHSAVLDRLGEYGKPIHITEQSVPSNWRPEWEQVGAGWWHRPWDEETQAAFVRDFYTIAFSKERVEAVTWWNINDNDSFIVSGGLLDADNRPKPAYFALRDLIAGWTSSGQAMTDVAGQAVIRGYGGDYELTVTHGDQAWRGTAHIWEQGESAFTVQLSDLPQTADPIFSDGFENADTLEELGPEDLSRWHGARMTVDGNRIELTTEVVHSGGQALKFVAKPKGEGGDVSKAYIERGGLPFANDDEVWTEMWVYIVGGTDTANLFLWDLEAPDTCILLSCQSPGRRLFFSGPDGDWLNSDLGKWWRGKTFRQPQGAEISFPADRWVRVRVYMRLSPETDGIMKVWQDDDLVIDAVGRTLPNSGAVYERLQVGITANGNEHDANTLYLDDVTVWGRDPGWE